MEYLKTIKDLIEKDIVLKKKHRIIENNSTLTTYFEIGRLIVLLKEEKNVLNMVMDL